MKKIQHGFTLIELMIVVAIIGILAAVAVPMYLDYTVRTQVASGLTLASGAKASVTEYFQDQGAFPSTNNLAGLSAPTNITSQYVSQIEVTGLGLIQVTFGGPDVNTKINNTILTMTPADAGGSVIWACTGDVTLVAKWLPPACR